MSRNKKEQESQIKYEEDKIYLFNLINVHIYVSKTLNLK